MSTIVNRASKGSPLTNTEVDSNFSNLNSDKMEKGSNLSDLTDTATARTNLGVYSTSSVDTAVGTKLTKSSNLSDLTDVAAAQTNLQVDPAGTAIAMAIALG